MLGHHLVIVLGGFGRWLDAPNRLHVSIQELFHGGLLTMPAPSGLLLVHRNYDDSARFSLIALGPAEGTATHDQVLCPLSNVID